MLSNIKNYLKSKQNEHEIRNLENEIDIIYNKIHNLNKIGDFFITHREVKKLLIQANDIANKIINLTNDNYTISTYSNIKNINNNTIASFDKYIEYAYNGIIS